MRSAVKLVHRPNSSRTTGDVGIFREPAIEAPRDPIISKTRTQTRVLSQFTLQDLGSLGEFVGALGVVISLIYLARQMSQNTTSVRAASFNAMTENSIRLLEPSFRDGDFAEFLHRAQRDPSSLSPNEMVRWDAYMTAVYRHFGNLVYQYRVGVLDEQMWQSYRETLKEHLRTLSWQTWFEQNRESFSASLVDLVGEATRELEAEERELSPSTPSSATR